MRKIRFALDPYDMINGGRIDQRALIAAMDYGIVAPRISHTRIPSDSFLVLA